MIWVKGKHVVSPYEVRLMSLPSILDMVEASDWIITDSNLAHFYPVLAQESRNSVIVEAGEQSKCLSTYQRVVEQILETGIRRDGRIFAIGGGVVGDLAGFVAATVNRGVDFIQVPTSLLAMVDSSVGGKVGIDLPQGKNLVGAFKNPISVELDFAFLNTLPPKHFSNGMAEVIKYGWIWDSKLIGELRKEILTVESAQLQSVVQRCIEIKRDVVEADFEERMGVRAILNFGHTVGHALETLDQYENLLHGEAIAIGMVAESEVARHLGISQIDPRDVAEVFQMYGLPTMPTQPIDVSRLSQIMLGDKKNIGNAISMSLVEVPGKCKLVHGIDTTKIESVLAELWS